MHLEARGKNLELRQKKKERKKKRNVNKDNILKEMEKERKEGMVFEKKERDRF